MGNNTRTRTHKLCPKVLKGCEHGMIMGSDGAGVGCMAYDGPAVIGWSQPWQGYSVMLTENDTDAPCGWCIDTEPAALVAIQQMQKGGEWRDTVCVRHALIHFRDAMPENRRPAELANVFRTVMLTHRGSALRTDGWERFDRSDEMFEHSAPAGGGWELVSRSSNAHYRSTGHFRATYRNARTGVTVTVHAVVK